MMSETIDEEEYYNKLKEKVKTGDLDLEDLNWIAICLGMM